MAVPTRYNPKRLRDYTLRGGSFESRGRRPSGLVSGPTAAQRSRKAKEGWKKVIASYDKDQAEHEKIMDRMAKSEAATVERLTKAYVESKKEDPEDALGNKTESEVTRYLGERLKGALSQASQRAGQVSTPVAAGVTPEQIGRIGAEGAGGFGERPTVPQVAPAQTPRPTGGSLQPPTVTPLPGMKMRVRSNGVEIELTGEQREGPSGPEVMAIYQGKRGWVPQTNLEPVYPEETRGQEGLQRLFNPPQREFQPF